MSTSTTSTADNLFVGNGYDAQAFAGNGRAGVPWTPLTLVSLGTPAVADANYVMDAATSTELPNNATKTYTWATDGTSPLDNADTAAPVTLRMADGSSHLVVPLDVPRNVVCVATHSSSVVAMTVVVSGYDQYKRAMTESFSITATGTTKTATGAKAFKWVESIAITSAGDSTANTLNIGTGSKLGLPYKLAKIGHMIRASLGGVQELINVASNSTVVAGVTTTATASTGDVRGTIAFNGTLDGSAEAIILMYVEGRNSKSGVVGVDQA